MSLITLEQFDEFVEAYPEMEQFYDLDNSFTLIPEEDIYGDTCAD